METPSSHIIKRGKKLSYLLRHDTSYAFDKHGWRSVSNLIANHGFSLEELHEIVATNNKQRYEFSGDMKFIRARQGHSINVDVELAEEVPPVVLYHGTPKENLPSILDKGICKMSRNHVHLSDTIETASNVGARRGKAFMVITVNAKQMHEDGYTFFLSRNGVWLTDSVPTQYIANSVDVLTL